MMPDENIFMSDGGIGRGWKLSSRNLLLSKNNKYVRAVFISPNPWEAKGLKLPNPAWGP